MSHLDEMRNFVRVVEAGSISRAAEQMNLAKSGVSRRLAELERRLGVQLINRTTRRSSLTDAGRAYYDGAVQLISDIEELDALVADRESSLSGSLRIAAPLSFGLCHLATAIDDFVRMNEALRIEIDFSDRQIDLVEQGVDLAIRIAELNDSSLQARRICPVRMMLCASPAYLEQFGVPEAPVDLEHHRLLHYNLGANPDFRIIDSRGGLYRVRRRPAMTANNGDFLRDMAVAGHGIILSPTFICYEAVRQGRLVPLLSNLVPSNLNAYAVYPKTRYLSRRARALIDFLVQRFGDTPYWDRELGQGL